MYLNKLREIRMEKGISQEDLAKLVGVTSGYLCHLEKGTRKNPSIAVMNRISMALNKSIAEIFFE